MIIKNKLAKANKRLLVISPIIIIVCMFCFSLPSVFALANPATVYCEEMNNEFGGYDYQIKTDESGNQYGVCIVQGNEYEAWAFLNGKIGEDDSYCAKKGYGIKTINENGNEYAVCIVPMPEVVESGNESDNLALSSENFEEQEISMQELMGLSEKVLARGILQTKQVISSESEEGKMLMSSFEEQRSLISSNYEQEDYSSWDWRNPPTGTQYAASEYTYFDDSNGWMTAVKDQGNCGSCWSFSAHGSIDAKYEIEQNNSRLNPELSEQNSVSCDRGCYYSNSSNCQGDCSIGGYMDLALRFFMLNGTVDESCFSYTSGDSGTVDVCSDRCDDYQSRTWTIENYTGTWPDGGIQLWLNNSQTKQWLIDYGPLSASLYASELTLDSGVIQRCTNDNASPNHGIVLVGYNDTGNDSTSYWIIKNSWGVGYQDGGYFNLGFNECNFTSEFEYGINITAPNFKPSITLNSPADDNQTNISLVLFNFSVSNKVYQNSTCDLILDNQVVNTTALAQNGTSTIISYNLLIGQHNWSINCWENGLGIVNSSETRGITNLDTTAPVVHLISPANNSLLTLEINSHSFNVTDDNGPANCTMYWNNFSDPQNSASWTEVPVDGSEQDAGFLTSNDGNVTWTVNCTDSSGNTGAGEVWTYTVDAVVDCGDIINSSLTMTEDLDCSEDGLIINSTNVTLDCAGHSISGNQTGSGVYVESVSSSGGDYVRYESGSDEVDFDWVELTEEIGYSIVPVSDGEEAEDYDDDDYYGPYNISFNFSFYEEIETEFYLSSNALITFGEGNDEYSNEEIPTRSDPNNFIALYWDDLMHTNYDGIYYFNFLECPAIQGGNGSCLIVEYYNYSDLGSNSSDNNPVGTFEAVLYDNGNILLQYLDSGSENGSYATVGIENSDGRRGVEVLYNENYLSDEYAILFEKNESYNDSENEIANEPIIIKNCNIDDFDYGVYSHGASYVYVQNNTINNVEGGVYFYDTSYGEIANNNIQNFSYSGIYLDIYGYKSFNTVSENIVMNGGEETWALYVDDDNNQILSNTLECNDAEGDYGGIYVGEENNTFSGNDVSGCLYGFASQNVENFIMSEDNYHDNYYGAYLINVGDYEGEDGPIITESTFNDNLNEGVYARSGSYLSISDSHFERNLGDEEEEPQTGLYVDHDSHVNLLNGDYINNMGYGIYSEPEGDSVDIFVTEGDTLTCRNNDINLESGSLIPIGTIDAINCTITIEGNVLNLTAGEVGYLTWDLDTEAGTQDIIGAEDYGVEIEINTNQTTTGNFEINFYTENPGTGGYYSSELGKYVDVNVSFDGGAVLTSAILKIYYTDAEITTAGLNESTLRIQYYNASSQTWEIFDDPTGGVNTTGNYVWANITHFSIYGVFGSAPSDGGDGSDGSSGGSGCITTWNCTGWSPCVGESQIRSCSKIKPTCYASVATKPSEEKSCIATVTPTDENIINLDEKSDTLTNNSKTKTYWWILIVVVIIIAIVVFLILRKRNQYPSEF